MATIKPTHKDPISPQSEKFEKDFKKTMIKTGAPAIPKGNVNLTEADSMLSEVEQSLKKKIWSLAKMEALVFSDPKLSAVYEEMAENGEEKYGYHYNETIQNMIFNDYVLNSPKYLQKYKMAIPKEKKRRDKSGINQLKKTGQKKMDATGTKLQEPAKPEDVEESTTAGSAGGAAGYVGYAGPAAFSSKGDLSGDFKGKKKKKETSPKAKPISTGFALSETNYLTDPSGFEIMFNELNESSSISQGDGSGYYDTPIGFRDDVKNVSKQLDTDEELKDLDTIRTVLPGQEKRAYGKHLPSGKNVSSALAKPEPNKEVRKPYYKGGKITSPFKAGGEKVSGTVLAKHSQPELMNEEAKSKSQQRFMGMVHAYQKGELADAPDEIKKAADSMTDKEAKDFASTKHKGLPEKVKKKKTNEGIMTKTQLAEFARIAKLNEFLNRDALIGDDVIDIQPRAGETPFELQGGKYQYETATFADGRKDIVVYSFNDDVYYDFMKFRKAMGIDENNIKEDMQTMIDNNGTSMSNKSQATGDMSSEVPMGAQQVSGLQESDMTLLEDINKELEAFSVHHNKLKLMAEDKKTPSMVQGDRLRAENPKNFKKDMGHSGTKDIIDVEKELQWKDQQSDVGDPQKLGADIEKTEIKAADMKSQEALKNVGDSTNRPGDEIPKRNLTSDEQEEVDLYRNGQHSLNYDNEPAERFVDRMEADQGEFFEKGEKQKEFKADAPMYNKDSQPIDDGEEKVQFDKNVKKKGDEVAWNERMGLGSNVKLAESMITGRYTDALGKRRLMEFRLGEVEEVEAIAESEARMSFDGLGNTYMSKTVDKKVVVNEGVVDIMENYQFYTNGEKVFSIKNPVQSLNEGEVKEEKPVINEQQEKMKHLLGYKPDSYVNTTNVKKNRGF